MAIKQVVLRKNADNTLTVRVGRYVEHIDLSAKTKSQVYDAVKYAIISKEVNLRQIDLIELIDRTLQP